MRRHETLFLRVVFWIRLSFPRKRKEKSCWILFLANEKTWRSSPSIFLHLIFPSLPILCINAKTPLKFSRWKFLPRCGLTSPVVTVVAVDCLCDGLHACKKTSSYPLRDDKNCHIACALQFLFLSPPPPPMSFDVHNVFPSPSPQLPFCPLQQQQHLVR